MAQPLTSTASLVTGRWALGADVVKGLQVSSGNQQAVPKSPYAELALEPDGTFSLMFGAGCELHGISGEWTVTPSGARLTMQPDAFQAWTDGVDSLLRPMQLDAALDGNGLRITGVDERGRPIDQRWRS